MKPNYLLLTTLALVLAQPAHSATTKALTPLPTGFTTLTQPANPDSYVFCVTGDNRSAGHGVPMPPSLSQICSEIGYLHPEFTLWTGDVIEGYQDTPEEANAEYATFIDAAALTGVPTFNAPGNHEFGVASPGELYEKRMGPLYGSFDYGNSHFIAVNTNQMMPDGTVNEGVIDEAQWTWLQDDLKANAQAKNIFVFLHHYVFGPVDDKSGLDSGFAHEDERDRFHALMTQSHVRAVFCGHEHIYWHQQKDGVDYYISGGAGAPLDASPENGGYLHYLAISVDGANCTVKILQPWHLSIDYPHKDNDGGTGLTAWVTNTNDVPVNVNSVVFRIPKDTAATSYKSSAAIHYKGKNKVVASIVASTAVSPDGKYLLVTVNTASPPARTVEITLTAN